MQTLVYFVLTLLAIIGFLFILLIINIIVSGIDEMFDGFLEFLRIKNTDINN